MQRPERLQSAKRWLAATIESNPERIAHAYRMRYRVDWPSAILELQRLGLRFEPAWLQQLEHNLAGALEARRRKQAVENDPNCDEYFAVIIGRTAGGAPYGVSWEELDAMNEAGDVPSIEF